MYLGLLIHPLVNGHLGYSVLAVISYRILFLKFNLYCIFPITF